MDHIIRDIIDRICTPPPPPTRLQRIRAIVFAATVLAIVFAAAVCCVTGFSVLARAFVRQVIG